MLIVDSNALLWLFKDDPRLRPELRERLQREQDVAVSLATPWELWVKIASGRLPPPPGDIQTALEERRIRILDISMDDVRRAAHLPRLHGDPFDRMIIAQALNRAASVLTSNSLFSAYGVATLHP